ncbi:MAG TPA: DUF2269 family protein [Gaiellaceae bacterium]|jgi:uncharacterized membrane protein
METTAATTPERRSSLLPTALIAAAFLVVAVVFCSTSSWYFTFKAVHVSFAAIWIGGGFLLTVLGLVAERENDPVQLAAVARQAAMVGQKLFSPAAGIVLLAGIAMMINTNWGWGHFWITAGLVGFASSFVTGIAVLAPRSKRLDELMQTAGPTAPETQAAIKSILLIARFDMAVLLLVIVDMVVKPFSS